MVAALLGWSVFWMVIGRHMDHFDFLASYPAHGVEWSYFEPAYGFVLIQRWIVCAIALAAIPGIVAGAGMLRFKPWARKLGILVSIVDIVLLFPVHLLLGVYGLVMLTKSEVRELFDGTAID